jgi:hypothetical protein
MAYWPRTIRDKPLLSVLAVAIGSMVAWFVIALSGPIVSLTVAVLALICISLYPWYRGTRDARVRAEADTFSFGDVAVRMQARQEAQDVITAKRREQLRVARLATP